MCGRIISGIICGVSERL